MLLLGVYPDLEGHKWSRSCYQVAYCGFEKFGEAGRMQKGVERKVRASVGEKDGASCFGHNPAKWPDF